MVVKVGQRGRRSVGLLVVPDAQIMGICACHQHYAAQGLRPMSHRAQFVLRRMREARRILAAPIGTIGICSRGGVCDAGKHLPEVLGRAVEPHAQHSVVRTLPVASRRISPQPGGVGLVGRSIVARIVETGATDKKPERPLHVLRQYHAVLAVHIAGQIHGAALKRSLLDVSVGAQHAPGRQQSPWPSLGLQQQAVVVRSFRAIAAPQLGRVAAWPRLHHVYHAANGARSVQVARASAHHFDALDLQLRYRLPMNPSGKRIVQRHIVFGD